MFTGYLSEGKTVLRLIDDEKCYWGRRQRNEKILLARPFGEEQNEKHRSQTTGMRVCKVKKYGQYLSTNLNLLKQLATEKNWFTGSGQ